MLELERKGEEVFYQGKKLTIVKQATKGPGKEVVKIAGLPEANGQAWISLSRLKEGMNMIECQAKQTTGTRRTKEYELTKEEEAEIQEYQSKIDAIIERAKKRYVKVPNLNVNISNMNADEKLKFAAEVQAWLDSVRAQH